jgi:hypothetical protein
MDVVAYIKCSICDVLPSRKLKFCRNREQGFGKPVCPFKISAKDGNIIISFTRRWPFEDEEVREKRKWGEWRRI